MFNSEDRPTGNGTVEGYDARVPSAAHRIVAIQGGGSGDIQRLMSLLAEHWRASGLRVTGVVEDVTPAVRKARGGSLLRNLSSGACYPLYQDLGPHSTACCLNPAGLAEACQAVIDDMDQSDVVVLSKFGKLEAERSGLFDAFVHAGMLNKCVLTSASPTFSASYSSFVGTFGRLVPADAAYLTAWARRASDVPRS